MAQRGGVVRADVFQMKDAQIGGAAQRFSDGGQRRQEAAGENVMADEIHFVPILFVFLIGDGDGL